ncbi:MAG TPA: AbrB/MazE/SpoVT family DNA-binding domain-containing protein [Chloroflexota bacterium]
MSASKMSAKGWVVIPKEMRRKYGLAPGTSVEVVDYGGVLAIVPVAADPVAALDGMFSDHGGKPWTEELLEERRREREREDRRFDR